MNNQAEINAAIKAIKQNGGLFFQTLTKNMQTQKSVIIAAVKDKAIVTNFVDVRILNNKNFIIELIRANPNAYNYLPDDLKTSPRVAIEAVAHKDAYMFRHLHPDMKNNFSVCAASVKINGSVIQHASPLMRDNIKIIKMAIENTLGAFDYIAIKHRNNPDLMIHAIGISPIAMKYVGKKLMQNFKFLNAAVAINVGVLEYTPDYVNGDHDFMISVVKKNKMAIRYASNDLQSNIAKAAIVDNS